MEGGYETNRREEEISLKELILKVKEYINEAFRKIFWIILFVIPVLAYFLYQHYTTPTTYSDKLTFMVNSDDGNSVSSIGSILGQFGFGGGGVKRQNIDKILELSRTRKIVGKVMMDSVEIEGKKDLLANHIIEIYEMDEKWAEKDPELKDFRFKNSDIEAFNLREADIFKRVYGKVVGNPKEEIAGLLSSGYSEETGIMRLNAATLKDELTLHLLNTSFEKLSEFYVDNTIEKQKSTYDLVRIKKDSIFDMLQAKEYALANFKQTNQNLIDARAKITELRLNREVFVLTQMYGEAVKNTEISEFTLKNTLPFVQVIDKPFLPIRGESSSLLLSIIKGGLIGGFLGLFFVLGRKFLRDAMA